MAQGTTYLIREGVRRAKLYFLAGHPMVTVDVVDKDDKVVETLSIAISQLNSPDDVIDLATNPAAWYRYKRLENAVFRGVVLPTIRVWRKSGGTPIKDVKVVR